MSPSWRLVVDDIEIDLERQLVLVAGRRVDLTTTEFRILSVIARQGGQICGKEKIFAAIWGNKSAALAGALRVHIAMVRSKICRPEFIETVKSVGYRLAVRLARECAP